MTDAAETAVSDDDPVADDEPLAAAELPGEDPAEDDFVGEDVPPEDLPPEDLPPEDVPAEDDFVDEDAASDDEASEDEASEDEAPGDDFVDEDAPDELPDDDSFVPAPMSRMLFVDVVLTLPSTHPVIVLQEAELPYRELRIPIGGPEGIAIGYAARRITTPRPLSHAFMTRMLEQFDLTLEVVQITSVHHGNYTAEVQISGPMGLRTIDCRPSDAIALALQQRIAVPIMVSPEVLEAAGAGAAGSN